jgi:hypothetical protein
MFNSLNFLHFDAEQMLNISYKFLTFWCVAITSTQERPLDHEELTAFITGGGRFHVPLHTFQH